MTVLALLLMAAAMALTVGALFGGLIVMARGGEASRRWSNRLMRWRVLSQAVAVALFLAAVFLLRRGG